MKRNSFMRMTKLSNVKGRINYISNPARQEHLYAVYDTENRTFWRELARENEADFIRSGTVGKCIEARELIIALPNNYVDYNPCEVLEKFTEYFKNKYGVACSAALHHNKAMTNYHIHLIFSERELLPEPKEKIATRNMFYDEKGRHVRTKKEIVDSIGKVREGCRIILKGQAYERHIFQKKKPIFKDKAFLDDVKKSYTELINEWVFDDRDKLTVFQKDSCYLPTKKIGKNNPRAREIELDNRQRVRWNYGISQALQAGIPEENLKQIKKSEIITPVRLSVRSGGKNPNVFRFILLKAYKILARVVLEWSKMSKGSRENIINKDFKKYVGWCKERVEKKLEREKRER